MFSIKNSSHEPLCKIDWELFHILKKSKFRFKRIDDDLQWIFKYGYYNNTCTQDLQSHENII